MVNHLRLIEQTVIDPDMVTYDLNQEDRESFYLSGFKHLLMKVCVEFTHDPGVPPDGTIVTAYLSRRVKSGERIKWQTTR